MFKKIVFFKLFLLTLLTLIAFSKSNDIQHYELGEKDFNHYVGPRDPARQKNKFIDDEIELKYFSKVTSNEAFDLSSFILNDFASGSTCPNYYLNINYDYFKYLNRLLVISYLDEVLVEISRVSKKYFKNKKLCPYSMKKILDQCSPQTSDMKLFVKRAKVAIQDEDIIFNQTVSKKNNWRKNFFWKSYLNFKCKKIKSCTESKIKKVIKNTCLKIGQISTKICSERDFYFGLSYVPNLRRILLESNIKHIINHGGLAAQCLERFALMNSYQETKDNEIKSLLNGIIGYLKINTLRNYEEGRLFIAGALKEFDDKGLKELFFERPLKKEIKKVASKEIKIPLPVMANKVSQKKIISVKKTPIKKVSHPIKKKIERPKPQKYLSAFEQALIDKRKLLLKFKTIDMKTFFNEFKYSNEKFKNLTANVKIFGSRQALKDMKKLDNMGMKNGPIPLSFIKVLILSKNHQAIYNLLAIIGEKFFVFNDIERKKEPVQIRLFFDRKAYNWQIMLFGVENKWKPKQV